MLPIMVKIFVAAMVYWGYCLEKMRKVNHILILTM